MDPDSEGSLLMGFRSEVLIHFVLFIDDTIQLGEIQRCQSGKSIGRSRVTSSMFD